MSQGRQAVKVAQTQRIAAMADARADHQTDARPDQTPAEWLTVKEYAQLKRVHEQTVREWIRLGAVIAERTREPRGHWRIKPPQRAA